jgi:glycosyltransferase involved in cell wall biosynthesis
MIGMFARRADQAIAADSSDVRRLKKFGASVVQVPIGSSIPSSLEDRHALRTQFCSKHNFLEHKSLIGHFGTAVGLPQLTEALAALPETILVLVGKRNPQETTVRISVGERVPDSSLQRMGQLRIMVRTHWTGYLPPYETAQLLRTVDVVVLPYPDGASNRHSGLIAALAQGAAIITTKPSAPLLGLEDGKDLLFTTDNSTEALVNTIQRVLTDDGLRTTLQRNAQSKAQSIFAWEAIAREHKRIYERTLG